MFAELLRNSAQGVLKQKLTCLQGEHKSVTTALEIQCRENFKVSAHTECGIHA